MKDSSPKNKTNYFPEIIVIFGYVLLCCLVPITFLGFYYYTTPKNTANEIDFAFATNLPPTTPTPRLDANHKLGENNIFTDKFNDNQNSWVNADIEIVDGKMVVNSEERNSYVIAACSKCSWLNQPFYMQAEFSTDHSYERLYGFVFKMNYQRSNFLLFSISPNTKEYGLYSQASGKWTPRMFGYSDYIYEFPNINTLGIYANIGYLEFYINGEMIDTYQDTGLSLQAGTFGFYMDQYGTSLLVDNLMIDKVEGD